MDPRVQKALILMENNFYKRLSFTKIAQSLNLSLWHLHHLFKSETGTTPARYLKRLRMQKAKSLLETSFLSVKEIMLKVGMHDESHFVRDFRQIYGTTPTRYRTFFLSAKVAEKRN